LQITTVKSPIIGVVLVIRWMQLAIACPWLWWLERTKQTGTNV